MLDVRTEGHLLCVFVFGVDLMNVALDCLENYSLAVTGPLGGAAWVLGLQLVVCFAVDAEDEDADVFQVAAGDCNMSSVGAPGGHTTTPPCIGRDCPLEGEVKVEKDGAEVVRLGAGEAFGEMAALSEEVRSATVTVTRDATVSVLDGSDFRSLVGARPEIALELSRVMARRLARARA